MLNGFEEKLSEFELDESVKSKLLETTNELAKGLAEKNQELLSKLATKKEETGSTAAEIEALRQFKVNAEIKAAEDAKNWEEATRLKQEAWQAEQEKLQQSLQEKESLVTKLLIDDGLNKALDSVNVNPSLKAGAEAMLRSSAKIVDGKAMIGDKALSEAVQEWAESDAGKAFCLAQQNNGAGATGGANTTTATNSVESKLRQRLKSQGLT